MSVMSGTELKRRADVGQDVGHESDTVEFVSVIWMTKEQAALHLGVSSRTVERRAKSEGWERDTSQRPMRYGIPSDVEAVSGTSTTRVGHAEEMSDSVADVPDTEVDSVGHRGQDLGHASETVGHGAGSV